MPFKLNRPNLKELGQLVKTCHQYPTGALLATLLILALEVSVAVASSNW